MTTVPRLLWWCYCQGGDAHVTHLSLAPANGSLNAPNPGCAVGVLGQSNQDRQDSSHELLCDLNHFGAGLAAAAEGAWYLGEEGQPAITPALTLLFRPSFSRHFSVRQPESLLLPSLTIKPTPGALCWATLFPQPTVLPDGWHLPQPHTQDLQHPTPQM